MFFNSMSQRHQDYCGFVKSRVAKKTLPRIRGTRFLAPAWAKRSSKRCLFENHENLKWHQKPTFHNRSALGPSKNGPGDRFWKNIKNLWKNYRKINGFWWSKTIEKYWKTNTFLDFRSFKKTMKKRYQRDPQKSCFGVQNGGMGVPGSTYRLIFEVLLRCQKIIICGRLPDGPKNRKNRALERQGPRGTPLEPKGTTPGRTPGTPPPHHRKRVPEDQAKASWRLS